MKDFFINYWWVLVIAVVLVVVVLVTVVILTKNKKPKVQPIQNEVLNKIHEALGLNNIISVEKEQDRIKLVMIDVKKIDAKILQELSIPAFLKGNEVKILFRNHSNELFNYLKEKTGK